MVARDKCPDPLEDPEGYNLWCEMHGCLYCDGTGLVCDEDDDGEDIERDCRLCKGTGINLERLELDDDPDDELDEDELQIACAEVDESDGEGEVCDER